MTKVFCFRALAVTIALGFSLVAVLVAAIGYIEVATAFDQELHPLLRRLPIVRRRYADYAYKRLMHDVIQADPFGSTVDCNTQIILSRHVFQPTEMFGETKYRYHPNQHVVNARVWSGVEYQNLVFAGTPQSLEILGQCKVMHQFQFTTNQFGFKPTAFTPGETSTKVFFLGDSFTEGLWTEPKDTFASWFGKRATDDGLDVAPINLGVDGYSALEMCWMLERFGPQLDPQVVIASLFPNDVHADYLQVVVGMDQRSGADLLQQWQLEENYQEMFRYLDRMGAYCDQHEASFVVTVIPCREQFAELRGHRAFQDRVQQWGQQNERKVIDLIQPIEQYGADKVYLPWDVHLTPAGHQMIAATLHEQLKETLIQLDQQKPASPPG